MKAMVLARHGGLDALEWHDDVPDPVAGPGEVLIKVLACGLNNTDVNTRTGWYSKAVTEATAGEGYEADPDEEDPTWGAAPLTFPRIQGADVCGRVLGVGEGVDAGLVGKRVLIDTWLRDWDAPDDLTRVGYFGSEVDGGFAEMTKAPARNVHVVESDLTDAELATFATSYITAENMLTRAKVGAADTVLVPGASGGVGGALIQLAKRRGARVIAMVSEAKQAAVQAYGPDRMLPRSVDSLVKTLKDEKVTVVADVVGGPMWPQFIDVLERGGRYTCAGAIAGPIVEFDLRWFYLKDLTFTGATIVPVGMFADLVTYIERGEVKPILAATYPLSELREAQTAFTEKGHVGNLVVVP
ncbi:MAG: alcohol dehydrogenase family protein [Pseudomonadota bacterium]